MGEDGALFAQQLGADLSAFADVTDLTGELTVVEITGPRSRDLLALGLELDIAPAIFPAGHCTVATLDRVQLTISHIVSDPSLPPAFQLAINTSDLPDFANWLAAAGSTIGMETSS